MEGSCSKCGFKRKICQHQEGGHPENCSTLLYEDALQQADDKYNDSLIHRFAREASLQEASCYQSLPGNEEVYMPVKPRMLEIVEFCQRMDYKKLGFAFCAGIHKEAAVVGNILESRGFEVVSVMCKVGGTKKTRLGLTEKDDIRKKHIESMCNPIGQALILNQAQTEFNIIMGLCVGHDSLFIKHSEAMCTVFMVKDRVMAHNPLGAIYTINTYYPHLK